MPGRNKPVKKISAQHEEYIMSEKITMEIINSEKYHRANIRFSGIPSEEVRTAMKKEGWTFSHANKVWYPTNSAADNSLNFAKKTGRNILSKAEYRAKRTCRSYRTKRCP